ncbi:ABC transporter permease [Propioniciclava sinopodophylli]|uniref:ABC transporter permease n=1 Tax=Propioniciclava sinopodophylli TaxID=1837344 RepID=UPI00248FD9DD|nr:ABC transporter permease [Propioniciclava sinopodophylli]
MTDVRHEQPVVTFTGLDHAALAARTRRWGWLHYARYRQASEGPFLVTALMLAIGNPILYLAAMGLGLGSIVEADVSGVSYLHFVAPGLLVATVATTGAQFGTWPIFGGFKWIRNYLAAQATPLEPGQMAQGETLAIGVRLFVQAAIFWVIGLAFGAWPGGWSLLAIPIATVAALAMFTPLMAYSATLEEEGLHFNFVQRLIIMPMFLFAGTFFPLESMPIYLQWVGWVSPMWHGTQLARMASFGLAVPASLVGVHVVFLLACIVGGQVWAQRTFTRRLVR